MLGTPARGDGAQRLIWLLDSDARVEPGALAALVAVMESRPEVVVAGSVLCDPESGDVFEVGGYVCRRTGELRQHTSATAPPADAHGGVDVEYVAACSMLVRASAVMRAGLLADVFINGDDAEWCVRLARRTGGRIAAVPASRVRHPRPDRMRTWDRFYAARNAFGLIEALRLGRRVRRRRAWREVGRALCQVMVGREDLAELHLLGMSEALAGRVSGAGPAAARAFEAFEPLELLGAALRDAAGDGGTVAIAVDDHPPGLRARVIEQARSAGLTCVGAYAGGVEQTSPKRVWSDAASVALRLARGLPSGVGVVSARARPRDWLRARTLVSVCPQGFVVRRLTALGRMRALGALLARGGRLANRLAQGGPGAVPAVEPADIRSPVRPQDCPAAPLTLSIVILAYNRAGALRRTLTALRSDPIAAAAEIVVVDNASAEPLADRLGADFPEVPFVRLPSNTGVGGFEAGVRQTRGDVVLLLDDDAIPDPRGLRDALVALANDPGAAAATLAPRHPWTGAPEWPFLGGLQDLPSVDRAPRHAMHDQWPVMGCANLVRRDAWYRAGGYEPSFFLYRNDTDLALKLLAGGSRVLADPSWIVWHDSPAAARKSPRWFRLATRNWVWMCRRHAPGPWGVGAAILGWAWAHRLAGIRPGDHWRVLCGATAGVLQRPPPLPPGLKPDSTGIRRLLRLRQSTRRNTTQTSPFAREAEGLRCSGGK